MRGEKPTRILAMNSFRTPMDLPTGAHGCYMRSSSEVLHNSEVVALLPQRLGRLMRGLVVSLAICGVPLVLQAQVPAPRLNPNAGRGDTAATMTAADSISFLARTTASRKPFHECAGHAFQTCASGETAARLSLDGTAYGVLISVFDDRSGTERTAFLWRITGRVGISGADEEGPGGGGGGKRGGRSRRGGG